MNYAKRMMNIDSVIYNCVIEKRDWHSQYQRLYCE